jgi:hypothetical protein
MGNRVVLTNCSFIGPFPELVWLLIPATAVLLQAKLVLGKEEAGE